MRRSTENFSGAEAIPCTKPAQFIELHTELCECRTNSRSLSLKFVDLHSNVFLQWHFKIIEIDFVAESIALVLLFFEQIFCGWLVIPHLHEKIKIKDIFQMLIKQFL